MGAAVFANPAFWSAVGSVGGMAAAKISGANARTRQAGQQFMERNRAPSARQEPTAGAALQALSSKPGPKSDKLQDLLIERFGPLAEAGSTTYHASPVAEGPLAGALGEQYHASSPMAAPTQAQTSPASAGGAQAPWYSDPKTLAWVQAASQLGGAVSEMGGRASPPPLGGLSRGRSPEYTPTAMRLLDELRRRRR